jgi:hypothetical protein
MPGMSGLEGLLPDVSSKLVVRERSRRENKQNSGRLLLLDRRKPCNLYVYETVYAENTQDQ